MEAFVYCWTDFATNKLYIGVHKGAPDDGYICSSKLMNEQYRIRRKDFSRQIIANGTWDDCYSLETAILKSTKADKDPGFYNQHVNNGKFTNAGVPHTQEWCQKHSRKMKTLYNTPERRKQLSFARKGKKFKLGVRESVITREKKRLMRLGKTHSNEVKEKIRAGVSKKWQITTPLNEILNVTNLSAYCRQFNLNLSNMSDRGRSKGYICARKS